MIPSVPGDDSFFEVHQFPLLNVSSVRVFSSPISSGSSNTVGIVFLLFRWLGAVAVKSPTKNCGVPQEARKYLATVDLPVFLGPTAIGGNFIHGSRAH